MIEICYVIINPICHKTLCPSFKDLKKCLDICYKYYFINSIGVDGKKKTFVAQGTSIEMLYKIDVTYVNIE